MLQGTGSSASVLIEMTRFWASLGAVVRVSSEAITFDLGRETGTATTLKCVCDPRGKDRAAAEALQTPPKNVSLESRGRPRPWNNADINSIHIHRNMREYSQPPRI